MSIEQSTVGLEGIQFAGAVVIDRLADVGDKCSELCAMEVGKHCTGRFSTGPAKPQLERSG